MPDTPRTTGYRTPHLWWATALLSLVAFVVLLLVALPGGAATAIDSTTALWFSEHRTATTGQFGLRVAQLTSPVAIALLVGVCCLVLYRAHRLREAVMLGASTLLAYLLGAVVKYTVNRARPLSPVNLAPEAEPSFPSGHVLVASAVTLALVAMLWRRMGLIGRLVGASAASAVILVVALDRLVVGAHWLTDVLASVTLGVLVVSLVSLAIGYRHPRLPGQAPEPRDALP